VLLWRFHNADGGGRCFPAYEKIAAAAKCARSTVALALTALEAAGLLTWVHRLVKVRRRERDLFGHWCSEWQVLRSSNGYRLMDPLEREPGRRVWCKSENPTGPQNLLKNQEGARLDGAQVMPAELPRAPTVRTELSKVALQREQAAKGGALLSDAERAALTRKLDTKPTAVDWDLYDRDLEARLFRANPN
jgi:Helix-turn-helix domain